MRLFEASLLRRFAKTVVLVLSCAVELELAPELVLSDLFVHYLRLLRRLAICRSRLINRVNAVVHADVFSMMMAIVVPVSKRTDTLVLFENRS